MKDKIFIKGTVYIIASGFLGAVVGALVWVFLKAVSLGTEFIWNFVPERLDVPCYTIIVCLIGAVIIGVLRLAFGNYPETMEEVMGRVKRDGKYPYDKIFAMMLCAFVPLVFGGSLGPEAGLTGVAVGLCYWVGDRLKLVGRSLKNFSALGINAALGVIFGSPLFGLAAEIEPESDGAEDFIMPKKFDVFSKIIAALGGLCAYFLLGQLFGSGMSFTIITADKITNYDRLMGIPLILIGIFFGMLYVLFRKLAATLFGKLNKTRLLSFVLVILGGLILGIIGTLLPMTMFSGEEQMTELAQSYTQFAPAVLILLGTAKLFVTNCCIYSGWKGGNFFPMIFSGVAIGYGFSMLFETGAAMTVATVTAALLAVNLRKPVAVSLLLLLCFPVRVIPWMILASFAAANLPLPKFLLLPEQLEEIKKKKAENVNKDK